VAKPAFALARLEPKHLGGGVPLLRRATEGVTRPHPGAALRVAVTEWYGMDRVIQRNVDLREMLAGG
jgi:hypothetical protein